MKHNVVLVGLILFYVTINAQESSPVINLFKSIHDFGVIKEENGKVTVDFELSNEGNAPLVISRVQSSCGCTASLWTKEPIPPKGKGKITATYDPANRPGVFAQNITVFSNASTIGTVLTIRGTVIPKPKKPEEVYRRKIGDLGIANIHLSLNKVFVGQSTTDTIGIYNFSNSPMEVTFDRIPKHITLEVNPTKLKPQEAGKIIITFDANKNDDWGFVLDRIRVLPNKENHQNNTISISANIEEDFSKLTEKELANAPQVQFEETNKDFGIVNEGDIIEHKFILTNTGKSDLIIRKIRASCGCTTVAPDVNVLQPGKQTALSASFRTAGFSGRQSKSITVITNDPKQPNVVLRLSGTIQKK
jgi:hypothetical protein